MDCCIGGGVWLKQVSLVSIVIPCHNYGKFIAETIASLRSQSYEAWEAIVVDDGSTDDTEVQVAALAQEDSRVFYVYQKNQGVSAARNTGMALARGEFVSFLDADDIVTPSKLQAHVECFQRYSFVNISYSRLRYFADGKIDELFSDYRLNSLVEHGCSISGGGIEAFSVFMKKNKLPLQAAMFRRDFLQSVGDFDLSMRALEDWDYILRSVLRGGYMASVDDVSAMALVRVHPGSATRNIAFSEYIDRLYDNVRTELESLRSCCNGERVELYLDILDKARVDLCRDRVRREKKRQRQEVVVAIRKVGVFDFANLYPIMKKWRLGFFPAYFKVFVKK